VSWGATAAEWSALKKLAKVDLLPVVSNPHAEISPLSKMKGVGKTPSQYNHERKVTGFKDWTDHEATLRNIDAWMEEPDFGVCIQTRSIRALDVDAPDPELAARVAQHFEDLVGRGDFPTRGRDNSGKRLLAFRVRGGAELYKRSFRLPDGAGLVEFLANGQQFIAAGTHPSGARYEWADGTPTTVPEIELADFERAWAALVEKFAAPDTERRGERREGALLEDLDVADPVAEHLIEHWETYGVERGMLYVECPWKAGHSSDSGETEAAWLLAGTGKYRNGHFNCQHASCTGRKDDEFFQAVGYNATKAADFEDLTLEDEVADTYVAAAPGASPKAKELKARAKLPLPGFIRDNGGRIETCLENLTRALGAPQAVECDLAFDDFRGELLYAEQPGEWQPLTDGFQTELTIRVEALGFKDQIGIEKLRRSLDWISDRQRIDTAREWLLKVVPAWDGVARIHRFWPDYMRTKDSRYTRALGNYSWTAQAGRILEPGLKVDMVPVLVGDEGTRKSSAVSLIAPHEDFFSEFNLGLDDEKLARIMRGCLVGELAELRGISARDGEAVLAWITRRYEKWTPKFKEYAISLARRLVFYGTTNDPEFLQAHMGFRRWLPVLILGLIDTDRIVRDRLQLWAEARDVFLVDGLQFAEVEELAKVERVAFQHVDPWTERVAAWLDEPLEIDDADGITPRTCGTLRSEQVLRECCNLDLAKVKKGEQQRIGEVLKGLGMVRIQRRIEGRNHKVWIDAKLDTAVGYQPTARHLRGL